MAEIDEVLRGETRSPTVINVHTAETRSRRMIDEHHWQATTAQPYQRLSPLVA